MRSLKYSLTASAILILSFVFTHTLQWYKSFRINFASIFEFAVFCLAIYLFVREIRTVKYKDQMSFGFGVLEGLKIVFTIAIIHSFFAYIYFTSKETVFQNYKSYILEMQEDLAKVSNIPKEKIKEHLTIIEKDITPLNLSLGILKLEIILGLVISLIIAAILRKRETHTDFTRSELKRE
jgi:hypothetical protein